jgi:serine/threonine protein kinase
MICREALLWQQLDHSHILPFLGVDAETFGSGNSLCLISPWMEQGTLKQYIISPLYSASRDRDRLVSKLYRRVYASLILITVVRDGPGHSLSA